MSTDNTNNGLGANDSNTSANITPTEQQSKVLGALNDIRNLPKKHADTKPTSSLAIILEAKEKLKSIKGKDIKFSHPILKQGDNAVIFPHTINVIQGQAGVHKSRLAETICSAFIKVPNCNNELLGFKKYNDNLCFTIVYVDTERNLTEQLPYALQSIQMKAGYEMGAHPANFEYISLLQIKRVDRFKALNEYLDHIRNTVKGTMVIVLDVSTDCIEDFNKTDKSMELIDLMNIAINEHDVCFICLVHENPGSEKARGHFGTELMNKASTVMQVSFEKDAEQNQTELIRVKYLKCRSTAKHEPFHIKYCKDYNGLVLANASEVSGMVNNRKHKADNESMQEIIVMHLGDGSKMKRADLIDVLCKEFKAKERTIENRLKQMLDTSFTNENNESCSLVKDTIEKTLFYSLKPI
jgi:hypothetical protein